MRTCFSDRDGAVAKCERGFTKKDPELSHAHFTCEIHRWANIRKKTSALVDWVPSFLIHLHLTFVIGSYMATLRSILRDYFTENLQYRRGVPH